MTTTLQDVSRAAQRYQEAKKASDDALTALLSTVVNADKDRAGGRLEIQAASGLSRRTVWKHFPGPRPEDEATA